MNKLKTALTLVFALGSFIGMAQQPPLQAPPDSLADEEATDLAQYLPPLSILIDSAIANATSVELAEVRIKMSEYEVARARKDWADLVNLNASYRYSDIGVAVTEEGVPLQSRATAGYIAGVGVRIPLSYFTSRKDRNQITKLNVEALETQKESAAREVKEQVILTYNKLLLLQRLIRISTEAKEFSELIFQMSEERFRDGELSLDQMGANTSLKARYSSEYETLKTEFSNTYALLERLVGMPLSKLQN